MLHNHLGEVHSQLKILFDGKTHRLVKREIPERKEKDDYDLWMHDGDLNDAMKKFAAMQSNNKYCLS